MKNKGISAFQPQLADKKARQIRWLKLFGSSRALALLELVKQQSGAFLVVMPDARAVQMLEQELAFFSSNDDPIPILNFPDWECLPYDSFSPHQDIVSQRLLTLSRLPQLRKGVVLTTISTIMHRLTPTDYVSGHSFQLTKGDKLDLVEFRDRLSHASYRAVSQVMEPGEFAVRGGIIDIYPMGSTKPYRIDLFDDEIDTLRSFDPETQRSIDTLERIELLPAREFPFTEEGVRRFRQAFRAQFEGDPTKTGIYHDISNGIVPAGAEYYLPLFFEQTTTLFDYLPDSATIIADTGIEAAAGQFQAEITERFMDRSHDRQRPILKPEQLFLEPDWTIAQLKSYPIIEFGGGSEDHAFLSEAPCTSYNSSLPQQLPVDHRHASPYHLFFDYLKSSSHRCLLVAETAGRKETLRELLLANDISPATITDWAEFIASDCSVGLVTATLDRGLILGDPLIAVITESQLYGERAAQRRRRSQEAREPDAIIKSLAELRIGDAVVHEEHGVGRYLGLEILDVGDGPTEFLTLEYADNDKLYLPVTALHFIGRYTGTNPDTAPLHRLGGEAWETAKKRAQKKAHDVAVELLDIYARRKAQPGYKFKLDTLAYDAFADSFPFEETPDQARAIEDVTNDMQQPGSMDRLVCGDVGFGKTEVALRAAFVAIDNCKQVVVLVPTTLLAQQHYQNFTDRFADLPVKVELLSRFRTKKQQQQVLDDAANGKVDIIIGTHRLIQNDVKFSNLGLVIIDEEHRFGVRQKEQLKKLRSEVDILTLTATPIPRTLNLGMTGLRDISIIATAPEQRLSINTFIHEKNNSIIREACLREIHRGGQVYLLHNEVRTMEKALQELEELMPEAQIRMAHGQMPERELERIMLDFYHQRFNILLCSTIIESGIDVPSANTIIIERADKFGLAQLHQLRGRVGRSHHRAYAYLLTPPRKTLTADARKRLDAISALNDLGAGFALASHDLEIRGAGELLGENQSGEINEIGFTMYTELLSRAVKSLKEGKEPELDSSHKVTEVNLHAPALFPDSYIPDVHTRLVLYKRIASATGITTLQVLKEETIDRFGLLPEATELLFSVTRLKLDAGRLGIRKIDAGPKGARIDFDAQPNIDPA
ncbi:MAG: transcription-repair coupling factor, partial [Proteobacteria bacterium]|nr:transcription-repair coupling factor [Pseudomonadota bacterium]